MQQNSPFTLLAGGTVAKKRLVKLSGATIVHNTSTATDRPIGVNQFAITSGQAGAVKDLKDGGTHEVTAAGAITAGADIYAADDGKVQALPGDAGTYRKVGQAIEAATADGDEIEARLIDDGETTTV